jgi:hypothetical protein
VQGGDGRSDSHRDGINRVPPPLLGLGGRNGTRRLIVLFALGRTVKAPKGRQAVTTR